METIRLKRETRADLAIAASRSSASKLLYGLAGLLLVSACACGQATDGILVGVIYDASASGIPNAAVAATSRDTHREYRAVANARGEYRINNLPVGRYDVSAAAPGFQTTAEANVELELNRTTPVNLTLAVAPLSATIEVREAPAAIDTATAQLQNTFDSRSATNLMEASTGGGVLNLSLLGAGVASSGGIGFGAGPSVGGQRPTSNSFNIDGVDNNNHNLTGPVVYVSNEAVAQFSILQNYFGAEFAGASGGIFNMVVRSGANRVHGSLYEYLENRRLDAVDATLVHQGIYSNPRFDSNRLGGTLGGPILKDKLFYFGDFEFIPFGASATPKQTIYAPTAGGYRILDGLAGLSKTNLQVLEQYLPGAADGSAGARSTSVAGAAIPIAPVSIVAPAYSNSYNLVSGLDWNPSGRDQVRGRYIYNRYSGIDTAADLPAFYSTVPNNRHLVSISEFHAFSPALENELRVSFNRENNNFEVGSQQFPGLGAFPNIDILGDLQLQLGPDSRSPQGYIQNQYQTADNLTWTRGRHTLRMGYVFRDIIASSTFVQSARGDYAYSNLDRYLRDLSPDVFGQRSVGAAGGVPVGYLDNEAFVNDDFRLRPNLTINLGLRYEFLTVPIATRAQKLSAVADVPGVITFAAPQPAHNWAPRLGFAYSPGTSGVWSIRGGIGIAGDNTYSNMNINGEPAFYQTTQNVALGTPVPGFLAAGGLPGVLPPPATPQQARAQITSYNDDQALPYAIDYTIGVQRLLADDYTIEARYVGTRGVHLYAQNQINRTSAVTPSQNLPTFLAAPAAAQLAALNWTLGALQAIPSNPLAQYGFTQTITDYQPLGNSRYDGLALQLNKRYSKNFQYVAAYTWSHNLDDSTATVNSTVLTPRRPENFQNLRGDWASSALDRRHRFTFSGIYDFHPFAGRNWWLKNAAGNWTLSGTYIFESPEYATVQSGLDSNLNNDSATDRAIVNPAGAANSGSNVTPYNSLGQKVALGSPTTVAYVATNPQAR
ncbi:MAG: carboxypeptidase regulatory-like domain-containing protein, partial [Bryobacteraceae bacterium]